MTTGSRPISPFLRDTFVATIVVAVVLAPVVFEFRPEFLRLPGYVVYFPLLAIYIVLGGETEGPFGPSTLQIGLYALSLGMIAAGVAGWLRTRFDLSAISTSRFLGAGAVAVGGTVAVIFGVLGLAGLGSLEVPAATVALVIGVAAIGGSLFVVVRDG